MVGRTNSQFTDGEKSMEQFDLSNREEQLHTVLGHKRFKLPSKFLEDCTSVKQASVPRKLRSAMKKRSRESILPCRPDSKKPKYLICGGEPPRNDRAKRNSKKQGRSESSISGPITKDEEEVMETLCALAGMFVRNNHTCYSSRADGESSRADTSAVPGRTKTITNSTGEATEELKPSAPSSNEERLSEETRRTCHPDGPRIYQQPELLDCKIFSKVADSRKETDMQGTRSHSECEKSNHGLHNSYNFELATELSLHAHVQHPEKMDMLLPPRKEQCKELAIAAVHGNQLDLHLKSEDRQNNGPELWPGLLTTSLLPDGSGPLQSPTRKIPTWHDNAACSRNPRPIEGRFPIKKVEKASKSRVCKISRKKCMRHVFISHLIQTLQVPDSKDKLLHQPNSGNQHKETEHVNTAGSNYNIFNNNMAHAFASTTVFDLQRNLSDSRNAILQQSRHSQGSKFSSSETEGFDFLSLSTSVRRLNEKPPSYIHLIAQQQHMSVPLPASKTHCPHSYLDQLSRVNASQQVLLQLPSYLRNSGQSFFHQGSLATPKEQQPGHMHWAGPIASAQFKPTGNSKGVAQFPTWQSGRIEPPTLVPFAAIIHPPSSTEVLGAKHCQLLSQQQYHNQQQQQQHFSLQSSFFRATGKSLDNLPHPVLEETLPRFHGGGALSLQLLCSERQ